MARAPRELKLSGVLASAITPHRANTPEADFSGSLDLLDFLAEGGVSGISLLDPVGEFFDYSLEERQRLVYLGVKRSRVPLLANVSHPTLSGAVHLADEAVNSGADGLMIMPPYFFRYSQAEIAEFLLQFAEETSDAVPILLHHAPQWASGLEPDTVDLLRCTGRFAAIVDSSDELCKWSLPVICGNDRRITQGVPILSSAAGAVPELLVAIANGRDLKRYLDEFLDWIEQFPGPAGIKRAVELRGQKSGGSFVPLSADTCRQLDEFSVWFKGWLPAMQKVIRNG